MIAKPENDSVKVYSLSVHNPVLITSLHIFVQKIGNERI